MAFKMKNPSIMKMAKEAGAAMKMKAPMKLMEKTPKKMKSPMKDEGKKKSREATPDDIVKRGDVVAGGEGKGKFKKKYFVMVDGKKVSVNPAGDGRYMYKGELIPTSTKVQEGFTRKVRTSN